MKPVFPDGIDPGKHVTLKVGSLTLRCLVLGRYKDRVQLHSYAHRNRLARRGVTLRGLWVSVRRLTVCD